MSVGVLEEARDPLELELEDHVHCLTWMDGYWEPNLGPRLTTEPFP